MADLEVAAADAVREGAVSFSPPSAREELLARAGRGGDWCVSYQVVAGQPVPAAACDDCGHVVVSVDPGSTCPACTGLLLPDGGVLDARFVGAMWPLAAGGWPGAERAGTSRGQTTLVVGPGGIATWALPMAGLGLRVGGVVPFDRVVVHSVAAEDDHDPVEDDDLGQLISTTDRSVLRLALLGGGLDLDTAAELAAAVESARRGSALPPSADVDGLVGALDAAFAAGRPGDALPAVAAALQSGLPAGVPVAEWLAPLLGQP
jgi:hypothetical protein